MRQSIELLVSCKSVVTFVLAAMALASCRSGAEPVMPLAITSGHFGGEALFTGTIDRRGGCIVTTSGRAPFTVLFDEGVSLSADGGGVIDPRNGVEVRFGERIQGGAGNLRENGNGWSVDDIEEFFGVSLPRDCPRNNIMRLGDMHPQPN